MIQQKSAAQIRVFLVEDHCGGLAALAELLQRTRESDLVYAGNSAGTAPDLLGRVSQAGADVVLVDLSPLPEATAGVVKEQPQPWWVAAIKALRAHGQPSLKIIAYSHGEHVRSMACKAGTDAFLLKDATGDELRHMIRAIVKQEKVRLNKLPTC